MDRLKNLPWEVKLQQEYYKKTAELYDHLHLSQDEEHNFATAFLIGIIPYFQIKSILDIGSGTGRVIFAIKSCYPSLKVIGIEPVKELREIGYSKGLSPKELIDGDANSLKFKNEEFDMVCAFGVLHHVRDPSRVIEEMLRVAKKAIFISDINNFGQGRLLVRSIKQILNALGLWKIVNFIKTRGKGYIYSEGDGISYSYSIFNNYYQIQKSCKSVHLLNTKNAGMNLYRTASHVALLGIK